MKKEYLKIFAVCALTVFAAYFSASYRVSPSAGPNMAWGATGASGTGSFNNHTLFDGNPPAITNCGTQPGRTTASSDNAGTVTVGTPAINNLGQVVPILQCTVTYATAFTTAPSVSIVVGNGSTRKYGAGNINPSVAANSTTATTY